MRPRIVIPAILAVGLIVLGIVLFLCGVPQHREPTEGRISQVSEQEFEPTAPTAVATIQPQGRPTTPRRENVPIAAANPTTSSLRSTFKLRGLVTDEADHPVSSASVTACPARELSPAATAKELRRLTDKNGKFEISSLTSGTTRLTVLAQGFVPASRIVAVPGDEVVVRLESQGATLEGTVYLKSTGEAVAGATVELSIQHSRSYVPPEFRNLMTLSIANGSFRFQRLPTGTYQINAQKHELRLLRDKSNELPSVTMASKTTRSGFDLFLYPGHTVHGKVTERGTGRPMEKVKVGLAWGPDRDTYTVLTGADGEYFLSGLTGKYLGITAIKKGFKLYAEDLRTHVQLPLDPDQLVITKNIDLVPAVTISGTVQATGGSSIPTASVSVFNMKDWPRFSEDVPVTSTGRFDIETVPFCSVCLKASAPGFMTKLTDVIQVADASIEGVDITLDPGGEVRGTVVDPSGRPVAGANVKAVVFIAMGNAVQEQPMAETTSNDEGEFVMTDLPSDWVKFAAIKEGFSQGTKTVQILPGKEQRGVILTLGYSHFIAGRITNPEGTPVSGLQVWAYQMDDMATESHMTATDEDGSYRVEDLRDLPLMLSLKHPDYEDKAIGDLAVDRDDADFVMERTGEIGFIGHVVEWKTEKAVRNFNVSVSRGYHADKDPENPGRFVLTGGSYVTRPWVQIEAPGYAPLEQLVPFDSSVQTPPEENLKMGPGGTLSGRVVSRVTKEPLKGVSVYLKSASEEGLRLVPIGKSTTGADGRFRFEGVSTAPILVEFFPPPPLVPASRNLSLNHEEILNLGDVELGYGGSIRGQVVRVPSGIGLGQVQMHVEEQRTRSFSRDLQTDRNGWFEITGLRNGSYHLCLDKFWFDMNVPLQNNEDKEITIAFGSGQLKGRVLRGNAPVGAILILQDENHEKSFYGRTDGEGFFQIENLTPGSWKVEVQSDETYSRHLAEETIVIQSEGVTEKNFVVP